MRLIDYGYLAVLTLLWITVLWYWAQSRVVGELWWSWVCIVAVLTLKIGVIARPLREATGGVYLDQLLIHVIGIAMITLTLGWLVRVRFGAPNAFRRLRLGGAVTMVAFLIVTWFLSPVYYIPRSATWIPDEVQIAPTMAVHWLGFHLYLLAFTVAFVAMAAPVARGLPPSSVRLSIRLLIAGAALFGVKSGAEAIAQVVVVLTGEAEPTWLVQAVNPVVLVVFALFLLAIGIPLVDRARRSRRPVMEAPDQTLDSLWRWIQSSDEFPQNRTSERPQTADGGSER